MSSVRRLIFPARRLTVVAAAIGVLAAVACGGGASSGPAPTPTLDPGRGIIGGTDTDLHNVSLSDIYFDTFRGTSVPLSDIDEATLLGLRDAIPPLDQARYEPVSGGDWLNSDDLILGYVAPNGQAYAFPARILDFHEIVNDNLAGQDVLISYCPLCRSAIVYDLNLDGRLLSFGNTSALYQSDVVMYDRETLSYWFQVGGVAIVGQLAGASLTPLPSTTTTWSRWRDLHPTTLVLSRETGFVRDYSRQSFAGLADTINGGQFIFPVTDAALDDRLAPGTLVLGLERAGDARAYSIDGLGSAAINDTFAGEEVVVFSEDGGPAVAAFGRQAGGRDLTFEVRDGRFFDVESESEWSLAGEAIAGELQGEQLEPLPVRTTFWFAFVAAFPQTTIYDAAEGS